MKPFTESLVYTDNTPFPNTVAKTSSGSSSVDGSTWTKPYIDDNIGFFQAVLSQAGLTPSGNAETAETSQILQGLQILSHGEITQEGYVCLAADVVKSGGTVTGVRVSDPIKFTIERTTETKTLSFASSALTLESNAQADKEAFLVMCSEDGNTLYDIPSLSSFNVTASFSNSVQATSTTAIIGGVNTVETRVTGSAAVNSPSFIKFFTASVDYFIAQPTKPYMKFTTESAGINTGIILHGSTSK